MSSTNIFLLLGGLGLFLYGMKLMSDGLEKVAGSKMKDILALFTKNRFIGVIVGMLVTAVIQSSSATTVMVVSFVNSGLISLLNSVGVIMGANIGTTITAQLVSFDFEAIAPLFIIFSVIMVMFFKNSMVKKVGEVILGFAILFLGMGLMKDSMSVLGESQAIVEVISSLSNPIIAILVGFIITAIIQSSSATTGILIGMASQGLVTLSMSIFIIMGCNIGSCVTAIIASITAKKDAKRAAVIHITFNVITSFIIILLLIPFQDVFEEFIYMISPGSTQGNIMARSVANIHTIFNVVGVLLLAPFAKYIVKLSYILIPGKDKQADKFELKYISETSMLSPATAVIALVNEINRVGEIAIENIDRSMKALLTLDRKLIEEVLEIEEQIDHLSRAISDYLVEITQLSLPISEEKNVAAYFHVVNDIERIGDHAENIAEFALKRIEEKIEFSEDGINDLKMMYEKVRTILILSMETFTQQEESNLHEVKILENEVDNLETKLQGTHIKRLTKNQCSTNAAVYSDVLSNLERISDHATNIAFAIFRKHEEDIM